MRKKSTKTLVQAMVYLKNAVLYPYCLKKVEGLPKYYI